MGLARRIAAFLQKRKARDIKAAPSAEVFSPYANLPERQFWKKGVLDQDFGKPVHTLYSKKFDISSLDKIATAGSCFAQHIARHMRAKGFAVIDMEPPPPGLPEKVVHDFGYNLYSARFGNIYTSRQLLQLALEATGRFTPQDAIWTKDGAYYDALRPSVEPEGLSSPEEVRAHRERHLKNVAALLKSADVFIFTLGLTETWEHITSGTVYPTAPGTIAGSFDGTKIHFKNLTFAEVYSDMIAFRSLLKGLNPSARLLLTVSPVPLTATASPEHVLPATVYSKSVLRAVAGQLSFEFEDVDYFPSYEIIASPPVKGRFYMDNLRNVAPAGVATVMRTFFQQHPPAKITKTSAPASKEDVVCEEALLEAFVK